MSSEDHKSKADVKFDSFNIGRKEKVDYFSKNQPKPRKKIRDWKIFRGKNKFILLGSIFIVLAVAGSLIYFLCFYLPEKETQLTPEEQAYADTLFEANNGALELGKDEANGLTLALAFINDQADQVDDINEKFIILMMMADVYWYRGMYQESINYLSSLSQEGLSDDSMASFYARLAFAYEKLGNETAASEYRNKTYELEGISPELVQSLEEQEANPNTNNEPTEGI